MFSSEFDTVYYIDRPVMTASLIKSLDTELPVIFGASFQIQPSRGYFLADSMEIGTHSQMKYASEYLTIEDRSELALSYGISGIIPEVDLGRDLDSISITIPLGGLTPYDSIVDIYLKDVQVINYSGNTFTQGDYTKTICLIQKDPDSIEKIGYQRIEGLKTFYNGQDGSITFLFPDKVEAKEYYVSIYDLTGRILLNRVLYDSSEKMSSQDMIEGVYLVDIRYKTNNMTKLISGKLIIPY